MSRWIALLVNALSNDFVVFSVEIYIMYVPSFSCFLYVCLKEATVELICPININ